MERLCAVEHLALRDRVPRESLCVINFHTFKYCVVRVFIDIYNDMSVKCYYCYSNKLFSVF